MKGVHNLILCLPAGGSGGAVGALVVHEAAWGGPMVGTQGEEVPGRRRLLQHLHPPSMMVLAVAAAHALQPD